MAGVLVAAALVGCGAPRGQVELAWRWVDRDGTVIFPTGIFEPRDRDACDLPGTLGGAAVAYDLGVRLEICDPTCEMGCGDAECLVVPPRTFSCESYRGAETDVPASDDDPYRITLRPVLEIQPNGSVCRDVAPDCIAAPGPRERYVEAGLVTDLQVYQMVVDIEIEGDEVLDLEACGCA